MDGTLLHDDTTISPYTHDILTQALAAGVRVVVA
ncbi:HAD hydrolase family protein, partial [Negativicoccus succinicivorans]